MHCANSQCAETNIFQNNATKTKTCVNWFLWLNQEPKCVCLIKKHQHWKFSWSCLFNYFIDIELRKPSMSLLTYLVYIFNCFGTASEKKFWLSLLNSKKKCRGGHSVRPKVKRWAFNATKSEEVDIQYDQKCRGRHSIRLKLQRWAFKTTKSVEVVFKTTKM